MDIGADSLWTVCGCGGVGGQVAARMVKPFTRWRKYDATRQELMKGELAKILAASTVSENTFEIASKSLPTADE